MESNYKGFTKGSPHREKSALPTPDLGHSQCIPVSEESSNQGLMPLGRSCSSHIYIPSPDSKFISEAFISGLGQRTSLGTSVETSLRWIDRKTSKTLFPTLTQHPVLFHSSSSPSTSSISGSINMAEPFCLGLARWWWPPHLCWSIWRLNGTPFHSRTWNQGKFGPSFGL